MTSPASAPAGRIDYLTPTAHAEQAYEARQARRIRVSTGGVPIPHARTVYRPTIDGPALTRIIKAAFQAYGARELSPEMEVEAGRALHADLLARFPAADMAVLERHGVTERWSGIVVQLITDPVSKSRWIQLPEPVLLPARLAEGFGHHGYHIDLGGSESSSWPAVPTAAEPFLRRVHVVRQAEQPAFKAAAMWPSQFKAREGRWPRWQEIESAFPLIGDWLEAQRAEIIRSSAA